MFFVIEKKINANQQVGNGNSLTKKSKFKQKSQKKMK